MICGELATTASIHPVRNDFLNQSPALCIFAQLSIIFPSKVIVEHGVLIKYELLFAGNIWFRSFVYVGLYSLITVKKWSVYHHMLVFVSDVRKLEIIHAFYFAANIWMQIRSLQLVPKSTCWRTQLRSVIDLGGRTTLGVRCARRCLKAR